jgi:Protein of unknown function (DUF3147)
MIVQLKLSALRETRWYEYLTRFTLGGTITVIAGLIAARFGPIVGGLFLAFPAIFPASATLIEKHVRERKEKAGLAGARRGKEAAALDAAGATLGSFGLAAFALVIWLLIERAPSLALVLATVAWLAASVLAWWLRRRL